MHTFFLVLYAHSDFSVYKPHNLRMRQLSSLSLLLESKLLKIISDSFFTEIN